MQAPTLTSLLELDRYLRVHLPRGVLAGGAFLLPKSRVFKVYAVTSDSLALFGKCRFTKVRVWNKKKTWLQMIQEFGLQFLCY